MAEIMPSDSHPPLKSNSSSADKGPSAVKGFCGNAPNSVPQALIAVTKEV